MFSKLTNKFYLQCATCLFLATLLLPEAVLAMQICSANVDIKDVIVDDSVVIENGGILTIDNVVIKGDLIVKAGGKLTVGGSVNVDGAITVEAGGLFDVKGGATITTSNSETSLQ